jgi:hypothetical protein
MTQPPPHLTPSALFEDQAKLDALRLQTYNRLLGGVHQKIKFASTKPTSDQMTFYDVPEWSPGCPRYDVKDAILYLVWNLRHTGFKVIYMGQNRLLISWKEQSVQYYTEDSPIRQAMVAAAAAGSKPPAGYTAATGKAGTEKKRAAAYKPATEGVAGLLAQGSAPQPRRRAAASDSGTTITFI